MLQVRPGELIRALESVDWYIARRGRGSHIIMRHRSQPGMLVIPRHGGGRTLPPGTLRGILRDARMTEEELKELL